MSNPQRKSRPHQEPPRRWQDYARWAGGILIGVPLFVVVVPLLFVVVPLLIACHVLWHTLLSLTIWHAWCRQGKHVLLVTSDSPIWRDYIAENILPRLGERAVVLNWSERRLWRGSLAVRAFSHWGGSRDFAPLASVFRPFRRARVLRFRPPFQEFKHGDPRAVESMTRDLFTAVEQVT